MILEATYVDDEVILLQASDNAALHERIKTTLETLQRVFDENSLTVNWAPGKTELVLAWRGKGSLAYKQQAMVEGLPAFPFGNGQRCVIVQRYKHVGSIVTHNASMAPEIDARKASAAFNGLVQKVFAQTAIREGIRVSLFRSLILSVLLYGSETWTLTDT